MILFMAHLSPPSHHATQFSGGTIQLKTYIPEQNSDFHCAATFCKHHIIGSGIVPNFLTKKQRQK